jgi:hypothetical protein
VRVPCEGVRMDYEVDDSALSCCLFRVYQFLFYFIFGWDRVYQRSYVPCKLFVGLKKKILASGFLDDTVVDNGKPSSRCYLLPQPTIN